MSVQEITQELIDTGLNLPLESGWCEEADNLESVRLFGEAVMPQLKPASKAFESTSLKTRLAPLLNSEKEHKSNEISNL